MVILWYYYGNIMVLLWYYERRKNERIADMLTRERQRIERFYILSFLVMLSQNAEYLFFLTKEYCIIKNFS